VSSTYALIQPTFEVPEHATRHLYVFASRRSETGYRGTPVTGIRDKLEEPHIDELMDRLMNRLARSDVRVRMDAFHHDRGPRTAQSARGRSSDIPLRRGDREVLSRTI
jgi:hypothetical protein